jgi:energy-coupling factor transporter ATP-binding protein EcfA2
MTPCLWSFPSVDDQAVVACLRLDGLAREARGGVTDMADERKQLVIDLNEVRGAAALSLQDQLFYDEMQQAIRLVNEFVDAVDRRVGVERDRRRDRPWDDPELLHEALLISGPRGSGKTTFALSLNRAIQEDKIYGPQVLVLPPLDPTLIDGDKIFLASVIANVLRRVEGEWRRADRAKAKRLEDALQALSDGLLASSDEAWGTFLKDSGSPAVFAERLVGFARGGLQLRRLFADFLDAAAELTGHKCFLLPIDDVDMAGKEAWVVLETVRRYLTSPRILPVVTGHLPQFRAMVLEIKLKEVEGRRKIDGKEGTESAEALDEVRQLAGQHLLKLIRPERRSLLTSARNVLVGMRTAGRIISVRYTESPATAGDTSGTSTPATREMPLADFLDPMVKWTSDGQGDAFDVLPDNARMMRALLAWQVRRWHGGNARFDDPNAWVELLELDLEAQERMRWRSDDLRAATEGDFSALRAWLMTPANADYLTLDPGSPPQTPWERSLVVRSINGGLRTYIDGSPVRALEVLFRVALPAAVLEARAPGAEAEWTRLRMVFCQALATPSLRRGAARLSGFRWEHKTTTTVQSGLARLVDARNQKAQAPAVQARMWSRRKKPTELGHAPWIRWLYNTPARGTTNRQMLVDRAKAKGTKWKPEEKPPILYVDDIHRLLSWTDTSRQSAGSPTQQQNLLRLVAALYSRAHSG